jgi:hypothetical protein
MRQLDDGIGDTLVLSTSKCFMGRSVRPLYTELAVFRCLFGSLAVLTRDNVGGYQPDQWSFGAVGSYSP